MATTTTNFGWDIPQSTDLVKDGATAIAALGQDIDTAFIDLKGGTTGQVLAKASNTDLDYSWVAQDDSNAIQNAIVDAKGDLIGATAADTPARLAVGTNGQILTADSTAATGLAWATPSASASGLTLISKTTIGNSVASTTVTGAFSSTYDNYRIIVTGGATASEGALITCTLGATTSGYYISGNYMSYSSTTITGYAPGSTSSWAVGYGAPNGLGAIFEIYNPNLTKRTLFSTNAIEPGTGSVNGRFAGFLDNATSYTAFTLAYNSNATGGEIRVYGYQNS
jgi:hypothetical protein